MEQAAATDSDPNASSGIIRVLVLFDSTATARQDQQSSTEERPNILVNISSQIPEIIPEVDDDEQ